MPLTFSHPAIVLIIRKLVPEYLFSLTALVAGSVAPDFEGFLLMQPHNTFSHTLPGMFVVDLPVGLTLCFLWHGIIKKALTDNAPLFLKRRLYPYRNFNWLQYFGTHRLIVIVSLFIGLASHLVWDAFTHFNGTDYTSITVLGYEMSVFIFRQILSSVIGLLLVVTSIVHLPKAPVTAGRRNTGYWICILVLTCLLILFKSLLSEHYVRVFSDANDAIAVLLSAFVLGLLITSLLYMSKRVR